MIANAVNLLEGIAWCLSEYVSMPLGQRIVGVAALSIAALAVYYLHSDDARSRAKALQAVVTVLSGASISMGLTMGHQMPEMEFLLVWMPLAGWASVTLVYLFNKAIYLKAFKPVAFPPELSRKALALGAEVGLAKPATVCVFDSGKIEAFSVAGRENLVFVSLGAMEALSQGELDAVLFHELVHLKHEDSLYKLACTAGLFSVFAPFSLMLRRLAAAQQEMAANASTAAAYAQNLESAQKVFEQTSGGTD